MFYTLTYVPTALVQGNNFDISAKAPLITDMATLGAMFQAIDATNGNTFVKQTTHTLAWIKNQHATNALSVSFESIDPDTPNLVVAIAAGEEALVGPFSTDFAANESTITVNYTVAASTDISIAIVEV